MNPMEFENLQPFRPEKAHAGVDLISAFRQPPRPAAVPLENIDCYGKGRTWRTDQKYGELCRRPLRGLGSIKFIHQKYGACQP